MSEQRTGEATAGNYTDNSSGANLLKGLPASQEEIDVMREALAYAVTMLIVCPCDTDTTKNFQKAVDLFTGALKRLHDLEVAAGRLADSGSEGG